MNVLENIWQNVLSFNYLGGEAGTVICLTISGILAANYGWECSFYVWGVCALVWFIFWASFVYDTPNEHPRILEEEKNYINCNVRKSYNNSSNVEKFPPAPILKILSSGPVLANIVTALGQNYGFYTILKMTPTYLNNIQHISIRNVCVYYKFVKSCNTAHIFIYVK